MKKLIFIMLLLLVGCGQDQTQSCQGPDLSQNSIVWQGYADQYQSDVLTKGIQETIDCLKSINPNIVIVHESSPHIIVTENQISLDDDLHAGACSNCFDTIYVWKNAFTSYQSVLNDTGIISDVEVASSVFRHEIIHWATGLGNDAHKTVYFTQCT